MSLAVYVAGVGAISAIGNNVAENLSSLEEGKAGIAEMKWLKSVHSGRLPVGEVKLGNETLAGLTGLPGPVSRTALLAALAAREALTDAFPMGTGSWRTGFISANTVGGMDKTEDFFQEFLSSPSKGRLRGVVHHECGSVSELVAEHLGIREYVTTISTACSSSANSISFAARLIQHDFLDIAVAGGADALTRFTLNGFNTLMILDPEPCRPFDEFRKGLNLGEGAAYLVLVSEKMAARLQRRPYAVLKGFANANDAYHQTASSPEGTGSYLAMKGALEMSGLQPNEISYINLHGTGTQNNDIAEGTAIRLLFQPVFPKMSSTKSFTGHTLGASGGLEAVYSVLSIRNGIIYPNLRFQHPMKDLPFQPVTFFMKDQEVHNVISNSFGFGGNCTSLVFSRI
jgi:3-oxoacyl-[acyl-carrier-protein] synthase-1